MIFPLNTVVERTRTAPVSWLQAINEIFGLSWKNTTNIVIRREKENNPIKIRNALTEKWKV